MEDINIKETLKDKNINELSRQSGIPADTIRGWKSGRHKPSSKNLEMLKKFLYPKDCSFQAVDK